MLSLFWFNYSIALLVCCHTPERGLKCPGESWRLISEDWLGLSQREARHETQTWLLLCLLNCIPGDGPLRAPSRLTSLGILHPHRITCTYAHSTTDFTSVYEIS